MLTASSVQCLQKIELNSLDMFLAAVIIQSPISRPPISPQGFRGSKVFESIPHIFRISTTSYPGFFLASQHRFATWFLILFCKHPMHEIH